MSPWTPNGPSSRPAQTLDRAVEEANQIKTSGSRMLAIGVGGALNNPDSQTGSKQISGPQVVHDADLAIVDSINDVDVALVTDFEDLASLDARRRHRAVLAVADHPQDGPDRRRCHLRSRRRAGT